uniref:Plastid light harvesting protein n=1 Tax=Ditylum brightwellii TaxID=49249 RepID=A0A7S2EPB3_9STRA
MKLVIASLLAGCAAAFAPASQSGRPSTAARESVADLESLAKQLNPLVGFYDPLDLSGKEFWGTSNEETIGFLRESEVKHGRIAMFAFVGYIVHANGIHFPWAMQLDGTPFPTVSSAPEAWDSISDAAKLQIFAFIGFLEFYREVACEKHYMKGGKIGEFPAFDAKVIPGGALNYYDPFGKNKNMSAEQKESGLRKELNNGRLAMLGIFGFLSEAKIEGSVPALKGVISHYDGEFMAPLAKSILPSL